MWYQHTGAQTATGWAGVEISRTQKFRMVSETKTVVRGIPGLTERDLHFPEDG